VTLALLPGKSKHLLCSLTSGLLRQSTGTTANTIRLDYSTCSSRAINPFSPKFNSFSTKSHTILLHSGMPSMWHWSALPNPIHKFRPYNTIFWIRFQILQCQSRRTRSIHNTQASLLSRDPKNWQQFGQDPSPTLFVSGFKCSSSHSQGEHHEQRYVCIPRS